MDYIKGVIRKDDSKSLKDAIEKGLDPDTEIEDKSLLSWTLYKNSIECVKLLLKSKAYLSSGLRDQAFDYACFNAYTETAQLLLDHNADIFKPRFGFYPLHRAVLTGSLVFTRFVLNAGASKRIDVKTQQGNTPLYFVIYNDYPLPMVSLLLDYGSKIDNMKNPNLHCELFVKRKNIKRTLIIFYQLGRKTKCLGKDMTNMIGKMVWETRDQDEWLMNQNETKKYKN